VHIHLLMRSYGSETICF